MDSTFIGLSLATLMLLFVGVLLLQALWRPRRLRFHEYYLLWYAVYFGVAVWMAYLLGGYRLAPVGRENLIAAYEVLFLFVLGFWFAAGVLSVRRRQETDGGGQERRLVSIASTLPDPRAVRPFLVVAIIVVVWALRLYLAKAYGMWMSGTGGAVGRLSYAIVILRQVSQVAMAGCILWAATVLFSRMSVNLRFLALMIVSSEFIWYLARGRRWLLLGMVILGVGYLSSARRVKKRFIVTAGIVAALLVLFVFPLFWMMRYAYQNQTVDTLKGSALRRQTTLVAEGWRLRNDPVVREKYETNMRTRPVAIVYFLAEVCRLLDGREPMGGALALRSVYYSLPAFLAPMKRSLLPPSQELLRYYGQGLYDPAISIPASFAADFGVFGGLIGGVFVAVWLVVLSGWALRVQHVHPFIAVAICAKLIEVGLFASADVTSHVVHLRNLLVLAVLLFLVDRPRRAACPGREGLACDPPRVADATTDDSATQPV